MSFTTIVDVLPVLYAFSMKKLAIVILAALSPLFGFHVSAQFVLDFESPTYSDGELVGQDGWTGTSDLFTVDTSTGNLEADGSSSGASLFVQQRLTASDLGVGDITNLTGTWEVDYVISIPTLGGGSILGDISLRTGSADSSANNFKTLSNFRLFESGRIRFDNTNYENAITTTGFNTVTLSLNFDTLQSTLLVNSSALATAGFVSDTQGYLDLVRLTKNSGVNYLVDSITVSQVPEPSTYALLGLGALGLLILRRRQSSQ
ncbi:MAG: PEP-CTERM sorting domain-containing protein [Verrucomicrobiota bacterium]